MDRWLAGWLDGWMNGDHSSFTISNSSIWLGKGCMIPFHNSGISGKQRVFEHSTAGSDLWSEVPI